MFVSYTDNQQLDDYDDGDAREQYGLHFHQIVNEQDHEFISEQQRRLDRLTTASIILPQGAELHDATKMHVFTEYVAERRLTPKSRYDTDSYSEIAEAYAQSPFLDDIGDGVMQRRLFDDGMRRVRGAKRCEGVTKEGVRVAKPKYMFATLDAMKQHYTALPAYTEDRLLPMVFKNNTTSPHTYDQYVYICANAQHARLIKDELTQRPSELNGNFVLSHQWLSDLVADAAAAAAV